MKAAKEVAASMMQYVDAIKLLQAAKIVEADAAEESED